MNQSDLAYMRDLVEKLQASAIDLGEGYLNERKERRYEAHLVEIQRQLDLWNRLPGFLRNHESGNSLQRYLKRTFQSYRERADHVANSLVPVLAWIDSMSELQVPEPVLDTITNAPNKFIKEHVEKLLQRVSDDPSGVLTSARSLVESVCVHILTAQGETFSKDDSLPGLLKKTLNALNSSVEGATDENIRKVLQGSTTAIDGLGLLRNSKGDGHGRAGSEAVATETEANLAICLAVGVSWFLLRKFEGR